MDDWLSVTMLWGDPKTWPFAARKLGLAAPLGTLSPLLAPDLG
jgi:hypothetical protein